MFSTNASTGRPSLAMRPHFNGSAQQIDTETTTTSPQSTTVPFFDLATTIQTRAGFGSRGDDAEESESAEPADGAPNSMPTRLGPQNPTSSLEGRVDFVSVSASEGTTTVPLVPPTEPAHPAQDKVTRNELIRL